MTDLGEAFRRAGFTPSQIRFAAACNDLGRIALNETDRNPKRAIGRFLDLARQPLFRDGPLIEYLTAIAHELPIRAAPMDRPPPETPISRVQEPREPPSDAESAHTKPETHRDRGDSVSETSSAAPEDHRPAETHTKRVPVPRDPPSDAESAHLVTETLVRSGDSASETPSAAPADHQIRETHVDSVPVPRESSSDAESAHRSYETLSTSGDSASETPSAAPEDPPSGETQTTNVPVPREPSDSFKAAKAEAKDRLARVTSGVYVYDKRGHRHLLDDQTLPSLLRLHKQQAQLTIRGAVHFNTVGMLIEQMERPAHMPPGSTAGDIVGADGIKETVKAAYITTRGAYIMVPDKYPFTDEGGSGAPAAP